MSGYSRPCTHALCAVAATLLLCANATAQTYPTKPVRIIVPFAAGGPADFLMRMVGPKLSDAWGQPVIIDNRAGGNQVIGSEIVASRESLGCEARMSVRAETA